MYLTHTHASMGNTNPRRVGFPRACPAPIAEGAVAAGQRAAGRLVREGSDQERARFLAFFPATGLLVFIVRALALIGRIRDRGLVLALTIRGPNFRPPEAMAAWAAARRAIGRRNGLQET